MEELKLKVFREKQSREFVCEYCQGRSNFFLKIFNAKQQHFHYCLILRFHYILYRCLKYLETIFKALTNV